MSRRPRRSGINFIENEKDRNLTYFKRRAGLYKSSADLTTLTGAKVAIVVEAESGKKSAFGTPSANPIIESFLSQSAPPNPLIDEAEMARITHLQDELFRLEKDKAVKEKRARETKAHLKEILETSGIPKILSDGVEDLGTNDLIKLFQNLTLVQEDINYQVKAINQHGVCGHGDPSLPFFSSSWPSHIKMSPRRLPWVPLQASSQSSRSYSSLVYPSILPVEHVQSTEPLHHQAHMMPPQPNEAHQYDYHLPQAEPPPLHAQVDLDQNYAYAHNINVNPMVSPNQNHAYTQNFHSNPMAPLQVDEHANSQYFAAYSQPYDGYHWPPVSPCNESYFDALSVHLGLAGDNGGQAADDQDDVHGPSDDDLHQQVDDDLLTINLWGSPFRGENSNGGAEN